MVRHGARRNIHRSFQLPEPRGKAVPFRQHGQPTRRLRRGQRLHEFAPHAFGGNAPKQALPRHGAHLRHSLGMNRERRQFASHAGQPEHPHGLIPETRRRSGPQDALPQIRKRMGMPEKVAVPILGQRVDGQIAAAHVLFQRPLKRHKFLTAQQKDRNALPDLAGLGIPL